MLGDRVFGTRRPGGTGTHGTIGYPRTGVNVGAVRRRPGPGARTSRPEAPPCGSRRLLPRPRRRRSRWRPRHARVDARGRRTSDAGSRTTGPNVARRAGRALMFSFVLRPGARPRRREASSRCWPAPPWRSASSELADQRTACTWPNDLLVAGRKAGGILAESRVDGGRFEHVVIGIGVNLRDAAARRARRRSRRRRGRRAARRVPLRVRPRVPARAPGVRGRGRSRPTGTCARRSERGAGDHPTERSSRARRWTSTSAADWSSERRRASRSCGSERSSTWSRIPPMPFPRGC